MPNDFSILQLLVLLAVFSQVRLMIADDYDFGEMIQPVPHTAKFEDDEFEIWGAACVRGEDGQYHLFYSRWPRKLSHWAWVTHSEIAHAVSTSPTGPWRHVDVALPARGKEFWDGSCTHNPTILTHNGKYYLYYMGNRGNGEVKKPLNWEHRNRQRIGVAVADSPNGPWKRFDNPLIDVSPNPDALDALCVSNPSVAVGPDGKALMIYKCVAKKKPLPFGGPVSHLVARAESPAGPFEKTGKQAFHVPGVTFAAEDPYIWFGKNRFWAIAKDNHGNFTKEGVSLALFDSINGVDWKLSDSPLVAKLQIQWQKRGVQQVSALERPQLLILDGKLVTLFCAVAENKERIRTYNVQIPLRESTR